MTQTEIAVISPDRLEQLAYDLKAEGLDAHLELGHPTFDRLMVEGRPVAQARKGGAA